MENKKYTSDKPRYNDSRCEEDDIEFEAWANGEGFNVIINGYVAESFFI